MSYDHGLMRTNAEWYALIEKAPSLSVKSKVSYQKQLRSVLRIFNSTDAIGISTILTNPSHAATVFARVPDHSARSYIAALLSLFKRGEEGGFIRRTSQSILKLNQEWSELLHSVSKRYLTRLDHNQPNDRERESHANLKEWNEVFQQAYNKDPTSQSTLLLAFHALMFPPLRGGDLALVRLGFSVSGNCLYQTDGNDTWTLRIRDHKTSRSHGDLVRDLPSILTRVLERNLRASPKRDWLFAAQSGSPYSDSGFSSWKSGVFHEAFGRNVTTNSLRHEFISSLDRQNQTTAAARSIAHQMGHGLHTQRQYIRFM
jgi:hypothetical protein